MAAGTEQMIRLNLGCGLYKKENFINVDRLSGFNPDVTMDLATEKWPWPDSAASEVHFDFSLEEMGDTRSQLFHVIKELYRVCAPDAVISIRSWHPRHDKFVMNPLCRHAITPDFLRLLSVSENLAAMGRGESDTFLGFGLGVDFKLGEWRNLLSTLYQPAYHSGELSEEELTERLIFENNVAQVIEMRMTAVKNQSPGIQET